jgi:hypothetical protein
MARTNEDILLQINTEANTYVELNELQANTVSVGFWRTIKNIMAFAINYVEKAFDALKAEIEALIVTTEIGSRTWYINNALNYQHGDVVRYIDNVLKYSIVDNAKRIVKKVSVNETANAGELLIKVVKANNDVLTVDEINGFATYMYAVKIIGTKLLIRSAVADLVRFNITLQLNPQLFNANGSRISDGVFACEVALNEALASVPFDGVFYLAKLEDALQQVEGVIDVNITLAQYYNGTNYVALGRKYEAYSGHLKTTITPTTTILSYVFN